VRKEDQEEGKEGQEEEVIPVPELQILEESLMAEKKKSKKAGKAAKKKGYYRGKEVRADRSR